MNAKSISLEPVILALSVVIPIPLLLTNYSFTYLFASLPIPFAYLTKYLLELRKVIKNE